MTVAGLNFTTVTTGLSSTFNSSANTTTFPSTNPNGGFWSGSVYYPDQMRNPFNISIGCIVNSTASTYNVEHSFDDYTTSTYISSNATWFVNSGVSSATTNVTGNYAFPVRAIRLNVTAGSSTGTVTMILIQAAGD